MGLDMYLLKQEKTENSKLDWADQVAYWRKFNALHNWFVEKIQNGIDECEPSRPISEEEVVNLLNLLKSLDKENCKKLLPTTSGFFFGSTQYDEYYWDDVKDAIDQIENISNTFDFEKYNLVYCSSW